MIVVVLLGCHLPPLEGEQITLHKGPIVADVGLGNASRRELVGVQGQALELRELREAWRYVARELVAATSDF